MWHVKRQLTKHTSFEQANFVTTCIITIHSVFSIIFGSVSNLSVEQTNSIFVFHFLLMSLHTAPELYNRYGEPVVLKCKSLLTIPIDIDCPFETSQAPITSYICMLITSYKNKQWKYLPELPKQGSFGDLQIPK